MSLEPCKPLRNYDSERDKLIADWPGWRIWYVPHTTLGGGMRIVWCAQPKPLLNCGSVQELVHEMRAAADRHCSAVSIDDAADVTKR
jgi:hypothetical protein